MSETKTSSVFLMSKRILLLCLGLMIFVLIRRHIRNKKDIY